METIKCIIIIADNTTIFKDAIMVSHFAIEETIKVQIKTVSALKFSI